MRSILNLLLVAAALIPGAVYACTESVVPTFRELLPKASSVVVVRIESISLLPQRYEDVVIVPDVVARVRIADTLVGDEPKVELLRFTSTWCGGHYLKVGEYYVLLVGEDRRILELERGAESIVYLFRQYQERDEGRLSNSPLIMHIRNFARTGIFPENFPVEAFLEHNRVPPPSVVPAS